MKHVVRTGWLLLGALALLVLMCGGCARPQYDSTSGVANVQAADAAEQAIADLKDYADQLRAQATELRFATVAKQADNATGLPSNPYVTRADIEGLYEYVASDKAAGVKVDGIARKGKVATGQVRFLGQRSIAIGQSEAQLLRGLGVSSGGLK